MAIYIASNGVSVSLPNVVQYGADPTGATDSTSAFAAMAADYPYIYAPRYTTGGTYLIDSTFEIAGKSLKGDGIEATILQKNNAVGSMITVSPGASHLDAEIEGLTIQHITTTPTSGSSINMSGSGGLRAHDFQIINPYNGFASSATDGGWNDLMQLSNFKMYAVNHYGIYVDNNPNPMGIRDFVIWMANADGAVGINLLNHAAAIVAENGEIEGGEYSLFSSAVSNAFGSRADTCFFTDVYFDGAAPSGYGAVNLLEGSAFRFENCWIACSGSGAAGAGVYVGAFYDSAFTNCMFAASAHEGGHVSASAQQTRFQNCSFIGNSTAGSGSYDGLYFEANTTDFVVSGCTATKTLTGGYYGASNQRYGINVATGTSDRYSIVNNLVSGNVTGGVNDGGSGVNKTVSGNY